MIRSMDSTHPRALSGAQVAFVVAAGLALALLIQRSLVAAFGLPLALVFCAVFFLRPDLGLLVVLLVRSSTDATLSVLGVVGFGQGEAIRALLNPNVGLILMLILGGGLYVLIRGVPFVSLPGGRLLALFLLTGLVGMIRFGAIITSLNEWLPVVSTFIVYALTAHLFRTGPRIQRVVNTLAVSFIPPALIGYYQLLVASRGFVLDELGVSRIYGTFVHPNAFALYLVVIISVFACQALAQSGSRKLLAWAIVVASVPLLMGTFSRFAWIGVTMVLLIVGVMRSRVMLISVVLLAILAFGMVPTMRGRLADPLGGSFADRVGIWRSMYQQWKSATVSDGTPASTLVNRLVGLGPGSGSLLTYRNSLGVPVDPHNDYVRILVEYGVFGLILYLLLTIVLIGFAYRTLRRATDRQMEYVALSFFALTLAYPIMSITDNIFGETYNQIYFWALAGLTVAASQMHAFVHSR